MKIVLVTMAMGIGGAETHILELAKELKNRNHEVFVVSNGGKYVEELEQYGIPHIWAPLHDKKMNHLIQSYQIVKEVIQKEKIDLVHSHTRISSFICGKLCRQLKVPFVTTAHWTFKVTKLLKWMTDWGEETIAVSEDIKDYLIQNYRVDPAKIIVTVNGVDTQKFQKSIDFSAVSKEFSLKPNVHRIVYISRLDESRALVARQLIAISEELHKNIPNLEIVIVGGGNCFSELNQKSQEINEKLNQQFIIMTNARTDINQFVASAEIFIGVSRAVLEAMAAEKPVIVAGNEGYLGIFDESKLEKGIETNFCCRGLEMSSEEKLKADIMTLLQSEKKEAMGEYNRNVVKKYYSVAKMTNDCEMAYQTVLKNDKNHQ